MECIRGAYSVSSTTLSPALVLVTCSLINIRTLTSLGSLLCVCRGILDALRNLPIPNLEGVFLVYCMQVRLLLIINCSVDTCYTLYHIAAYGCQVNLGIKDSEEKKRE